MISQQLLQIGFGVIGGARHLGQHAIITGKIESDMQRMLRRERQPGRRD